MRIVALALVVLAALISGGCGRVTAETTSPLYDASKDLKFDPRLEGVWLPDTLLLNLRRGLGNQYIAQGGGMSWLVVFGDSMSSTSGQPLHLVRLGKYDYFFAAPKPDEPGTSLTGCCRVEFFRDRIIMRGLNLQHIVDDLLAHPDALKHEWHPTTQATITIETQPCPPATQPATAPTTTPAAITPTGDATNPVTAVAIVTQPTTAPADHDGSQPATRRAASAPTTQPVTALAEEPRSTAASIGTTNPTTAVATTTGPNSATSPATQEAYHAGDLKITDDPAAVRAYLIKHQDDDGFFVTPIVFYRIAR